MPLADHLSQYSLLIIIVVFATGSAVVWFSGWRLSQYADALIKKTGASDVAIGTLLLGGVTSLPEVVTTVTASSFDNAGIALIICSVASHSKLHYSLSPMFCSKNGQFHP